MSHKHGSERLETKNLKIAFLLNLSFTVIELIGGVFTNSIAILSDAAHDFGDTISLGFAWYFQKISVRDGDQQFTYGYRRYSVLGALITLFVLLLGCLFILIEAIPRLFHPEQVDARGMFFLAILGIGVNMAAMLQLRKGTSLNEKVSALHLLEDVLGWVAVLIGSIVMFFADLPIIDPLLSIGIALLILFNVYKNLRQTLAILLQRTPKNVSIPQIREVILSQTKVKAVEDIHIWTLDGSYHIMTADLYLEPSLNVKEIEEITLQLRHDLVSHNLLHVTFEIRSIKSV